MENEQQTTNSQKTSQNQSNIPTSTKNASNSKNIGMAVLAYLGILVIIPLISDVKNDPFVKYHTKQGLTLLITWIIVMCIWRVPFIGFMFGWILQLACFVLMVIGIINSVNSQVKPLPIIGKFSDKFNF
jgi:uncharacterized membrane protein